MIVIVDASTFIGLSMIKKLSLLSDLFEEVVLPRGVYFEVLKGKEKDPKGMRKYIKTAEVNDRTAVDLMLESYGRGEAEVLVLAKELNAQLLLMDERKARKAARRAGFKVMGILGILLTAKEKGFIRNVKPLMLKLKRQASGCDKVIEEVLKQAGEND
jgi:predicted nucleic acid-binding protein